MNTPVFLFALLCFNLAEAEELNRRLQELVTIVNSLMTEFVTLSKDIRAQSEKLEEQRALEEDQFFQRKTQDARLKRIIQKLKEQKLMLEEQEKMLRDRKPQLTAMTVPTVAFTATFAHTSSIVLDPLKAAAVIRFPNVITNVGNAYNPLTGIFTAPVKGVYRFDVHILGNQGAPPSGELMRNSELIVTAFVDKQESENQKASVSVCILAEAQDQVYVNLRPGTKIHDNADHHTIFDGQLIFTM